MVGRFTNSVIVMMGCDGLKSQTTARTFLDRGASAVVSWDNPVTPDHTDQATLNLLEKLVVKGLSVKDAVAQTAVEVGPDPTYGAKLGLLE